MKTFPILYQGTNKLEDWPDSILWEMIEIYEAQVTQNHGQFLPDLAKSGGLSPREIIAAMKGLPIADKAALPATDAMEILVAWIDEEKHFKQSGL